jgi:hypothetical protein
MPTILPKVAPTAIDGTKIPAGTLQPYEMMTRAVLMTVANRRELTICHCSEVLNHCEVLAFDCHARADANTDSLAETVVVTATFALLEQYFQALCHIYPQKTIQIPNNGG